MLFKSEVHLKSNLCAKEQVLQHGHYFYDFLCFFGKKHMCMYLVFEPKNGQNRSFCAEWDYLVKKYILVAPKQNLKAISLFYRSYGPIHRHDI